MAKRMKFRQSAVMLFILVGAAFFLAAPDKEKPEKITVGGIIWNTYNQAFDVQILLSSSLADEVARNGDYVLTQTRHFDGDGDFLGSLGPQQDTIVLNGTGEERGREMVPAEPVRLNYDSSSSVGSTELVEITVQIPDASGKARSP